MYLAARIMRMALDLPKPGIFTSWSRSALASSSTEKMPCSARMPRVVLPTPLMCRVVVSALLAMVICVVGMVGCR
jgi:hypothetical protein